MLSCIYGKNCQFFWDQQVQSKLHAVHPELGLWLHSSERRRDKLILCRLRIGHTHLTHRHLLVGDPPPVCVSCQERLSVEHILIHCAENIKTWNSNINVNTVREVWYSSSCVNYFIHTKSWPLIFNLMVLNYLVIHIFSSHYRIHVFEYCIILVLNCTFHQFSIFIVMAQFSLNSVHKRGLKHHHFPF